MAKGRCAGCGKTDSSCKVMDSHVVTCPDFIRVYRENPAKALNPREEFDRWNAEENSPEARAEAKDLRLTARFAALDQRRMEQSERWQKPKDPLDD
jgi:hypothetical protein